MDVEDVFYEENEEVSRKKIKENEEKMLMAEFSQVFIFYWFFLVFSNFLWKKLGFREGFTQFKIIPEEFSRGKTQGFTEHIDEGFIDGFIE